MDPWLVLIGPYEHGLLLILNNGWMHRLRVNIHSVHVACSVTADERVHGLEEVLLEAHQASVGCVVLG